jgi:ATP synthase protein I
MAVESDLSAPLAISRILVAQVALGAALAAIAYGVEGSSAGYSALLGCLICVLPNAVLALHILAGGLVRDARRLIRASYIGMALKLVLTAALFTIVFVTVRPLAAGWLFAGFMVTQAVIWAAPVLTRRGGAAVTE